MIWSAWQTFSTEKLYIGILTTSLLGLLLHHGLLRLETRLIPWAVRESDRNRPRHAPLVNSERRRTNLLPC